MNPHVGVVFDDHGPVPFFVEAEGGVTPPGRLLFADTLRGRYA
jgi:hypothetical protein